MLNKLHKLDNICIATYFTEGYDTLEIGVYRAFEELDAYVSRCHIFYASSITCNRCRQVSAMGKIIKE